MKGKSSLSCLGFLFCLALPLGALWLLWSFLGSLEWGTLRLWAMITTVLCPLGCLTGYILGRQKATAFLEGIRAGAKEITGQAEKVANLRVTMARRVRSRPEPHAPNVNVFLPGQPGAPISHRALPGDEETIDL